MFRLKADSDKAVERFIRRAAAAGTVWVLDEDGSVAGCRSSDDEADVFPVFSDRAYAVRAAAAWHDEYPPAEVSREFYTRVLEFQSENGMLAGPNRDGNMAGAEVPSGDLLERLRAAVAGD